MANFYLDVIAKSPNFMSKKRIGDPALLEPRTRRLVEQIVSKAKAMGIEVMTFETFRSRERQEELFRQGATKLRQVGVHHYGLACDIVRVVDGQPSWKGDFSFLRDLSRSAGLIWGGDWGTPGSHHDFVDSDHVQRCAIARQPQLFSGTWYPDDNYNPYHDEPHPLWAETLNAARVKTAKTSKKSATA